MDNIADEIVDIIISEAEGNIPETNTSVNNNGEITW